MATTYTTYNRVGNILGFPNSWFNGSSTPTSTVIDEFINDAEDYIDFSTGHAWREVTVTDEMVNPSSIYQYGTGISFKLQNRVIRSITKLEIWDGSNWVDWVATKTEGRNADYWVDLKNGVVYLVSVSTIFPQGVKVTYTFGESTIPRDINEATALYAAILIANAPEFSTVLFTEAGQNQSKLNDKIDKWQLRLDDILSKRSEFKIS